MFLLCRAGSGRVVRLRLHDGLSCCICRWVPIPIFVPRDTTIAKTAAAGIAAAAVLFEIRRHAEYLLFSMLVVRRKYSRNALELIQDRYGRLPYG